MTGLGDFLKKVAKEGSKQFHDDVQPDYGYRPKTNRGKRTRLRAYNQFWRCLGCGRKLGMTETPCSECGSSEKKYVMVTDKWVANKRQEEDPFS